jgi:CopG family transcriptional regulator/antitoxin EndoAI
MHRRINVTLPEATVKLIDRVAKKGDRSRFINQAVKHYVEDVSRNNLRRRLKEGALARASRDASLASEWLSLDEQAWQNDKR